MFFGVAQVGKVGVAATIRISSAAHQRALWSSPTIDAERRARCTASWCEAWSKIESKALDGRSHRPAPASPGAASRLRWSVHFDSRRSMKRRVDAIGRE